MLFITLRYCTNILFGYGINPRTNETYLNRLKKKCDGLFGTDFLEGKKKIETESYNEVLNGAYIKSIKHVYVEDEDHNKPFSWRNGEEGWVHGVKIEKPPPMPLACLV